MVLGLGLGLRGLPLSTRHVAGHAQSPRRPPPALMTKVMTTNDSVDFHCEIRAGAPQWDHESFPVDLTPLSEFTFAIWPP